jgi:hypothetical protein
VVWIAVVAAFRHYSGPLRTEAFTPPRTDRWEPAANYGDVDLRSRGISETQARDLRARLKTFAEDWDRREAAIYDEDPAR